MSIMTNYQRPTSPPLPPAYAPPPGVRDSSTACTVLTVVVAILALPAIGLCVGVALGMVWGAPGAVVLLAVLVVSPAIVALMVPEIYKWLRRTL